MTTPTHGGRTRDLLLASARAARACGTYESAASIAGWLLERADGCARDAIGFDAPVSSLRLAQARSHLALVMAEEGTRPGVDYNPVQRRRDAEALASAMGFAPAETDT